MGICWHHKIKWGKNPIVKAFIYTQKPTSCTCRPQPAFSRILSLPACLSCSGLWGCSILPPMNFPGFASRFHSPSPPFSLSDEFGVLQAVVSILFNAFWKLLVAGSGSYLTCLWVLSLMLLLPFRPANEGWSVLLNVHRRNFFLMHSTRGISRQFLMSTCSKKKAHTLHL